MTEKMNNENKSIVIWDVSENERRVRMTEERASNLIESRFDQGSLSVSSPFI